MDKFTLQEYIDLNYSTRKIAELEQSSQTNVRHWLKKYNLKTNLEQFNLSEYNCECGEKDPEMFYGHSKKNCSRKIHRFYSESQSTTSKTPSNMMVGTLKGKVLVQ